MTNTNSNTQPVLEAGREAYKRIQESGKMLREDWRTVGEALLVGRASCLSPKTGKPNNKKFGGWCVAEGFGSINRPDRAGAMWMAEHPEQVSVVITDNDSLNSPQKLRAAFRKATKITEEIAVKAMKLFRRADDEASSDAEVESALKALDKMAAAACLDRASFIDACSDLEKKKEEGKAAEDYKPAAADPEFRENIAAAMQEQLELLRTQVETLTSILTAHGIAVPV